MSLLGSFERAALFIGLLVVAVLIYKIWKDRNMKNRTEEMVSENIEKQVSKRLADYVLEKAIAIEGDGSYGFRVVGEKYHKEAYKELAEHMQIDENETVKLQTQLICQPKNPHDATAVAVTLGGYLIGWVPKYESERIHNFLMPFGGIGAANSELSFDLEKEEFDVHLDIGYPLAKLPLKPFEA
jgi:hypothetical protein